MLPASARRGARRIHAPQWVRNEAEELQRPIARIAELVDFVGGDVDGHAGTEPMFAAAVQHDAVALQDEHLVLEAVRMPRCISRRGPPRTAAW